MIDFLWHHCKCKKGFKTYTYHKLSDELEEYASCFPMMCTQELVDWAKTCHPNVSIHAYDSTWRKFVKHAVRTTNDVRLVYYVKDKPSLSYYRPAAQIHSHKSYMSDVKWSRRHEYFTVLNDLGEEEELHVSNHIVVLPEDIKLEPVIDQYMMRTNYFVEYLQFDNNRRLDGFIDRRNNMYVLNNEYDTRRETCDQLKQRYQIADFVWKNQSYTSLASSLFKQMCGYLPESSYDIKTRQVLDDFYPRALQWCSTDQQPLDLVNIDISKCYSSVLINNKAPIPIYTIHDIIEPFTHRSQLDKVGEFYIDEYVIQRFGAEIKIEAGFYSRDLVRYLVNMLHMPVSNVK